MKRRDFIKVTAASGLLLLAPGMTACTARDLSIDKALTVIQRMKSSPALHSRSELSPYQILVHCTQSIDCALDGYPEMKPAWFQSSIGKAAFHAFSLMDKMKHDRNAPIPGVPAPEREGDVKQALARLEEAFLKLKGASTTHPHFFFGELTHEDMEKAQVLHFYNHMEQMSWKKA